MSSFDELAARYRQARESGTQRDLDAVLADVPDEELEAFLDRLERHVPVASTDIDRGAFERALVRRGIDGADAQQIAAHGLGSFSEVMQSRMQQADVGVEQLADRIVDAIETLDAADTPRVRRYLQRLVDERHDPRRLAPRTVAAIGEALGVAGSTLLTARDRVSAAAAAPMAAAAARGDAEGLDLVQPSTDGDEVDQLFDRPPGTARTS